MYCFLGEKREKRCDNTIFDNKRSEEEILAQILRSAKKEVNKTHLLYSTNISYSNFVKYFNFLLEKDFIQVKQGNPTGKVYITTEKGEKFLESIHSMLADII